MPTGAGGLFRLAAAVTLLALAVVLLNFGWQMMPIPPLLPGVGELGYAGRQAAGFLVFAGVGVPTLSAAIAVFFGGTNGARWGVTVSLVCGGLFALGTVVLLAGAIVHPDEADEAIATAGPLGFVVVAYAFAGFASTTAMRARDKPRGGASTSLYRFRLGGRQPALSALEAELAHAADPNDRPATLIREYRGEQPADALVLMRGEMEELAKYAYTPTSGSWAPGQRGLGPFLVAIALMVVVVGIWVFLYAVTIKPDGTLTVTYTRQDAAAPAAIAQ